MRSGRKGNTTDNMQQANRCPGCGSPTAPGQQFCGGCGTMVNTGCPYCGATAPPDSRFCSNCGAAVGGGVPQQSGWGQPAPRKQPLSTRQLLLIVLLILLLGLGALIIWQFGPSLIGSSSPSTGPTVTTDTTPRMISSVSVESIVYAQPEAKGATVSR